MIEQKKFYSIAYSEQNIHETHKSILNKKQQQKAQIKRGGTKKKKHKITVSNLCDLHG